MRRYYQVFLSSCWDVARTVTRLRLSRKSSFDSEVMGAEAAGWEGAG